MAQKPKTQEMASAFLASSIIYKNNFIDVRSELMFHVDQNVFYYYDKKSGAWVLIPAGNKETGPQARMIASFIGSNFPDVDITSNAIKELKNAIIRDIGNTFSDEDYKKHPFTAFRDGIFDWSTFTLLPHDKKLVAFHSFDFDCPHFTQDIPTPVFDAYLKRVFLDDLDTQRFIPEMFGYYLLPQTKEPSAFYLYGYARTGKSVMLDLVEKLIGEQFCCSFSLQSLTHDKYTIAELAGKRINIQDEDESEFILSDKFKALISNGRMQAERKYESPFTVRVMIKLLFGSNQLPMFKNVDDGLMRRLRFIEFKHPLAIHEQDKNILSKLVQELPGIVQKSMRAAEAFVNRKEEFSLPESSIRTSEQFATESEPALAFMEEMYTIVPDAPDDAVPSEGWSPFADIYRDYREWCKESGKYPKSKPKFTKILDRIPNLKTGRTNDARFRSCMRKGLPPQYPRPLF